MKAIQEAVLFELVSVVKWSFIATETPDLVFPESKLVQNRFFFTHQGFLRVVDKLACDRFQINTEVYKIAILAFFLDLS